MYVLPVIYKIMAALFAWGCVEEVAAGEDLLRLYQYGVP